MMNNKVLDIIGAKDKEGQTVGVHGSHGKDN
jgi:hypothetical protein